MTASDIVCTEALLTWTAANDVTAVTRYRIYQDGVLLETMDSATFTYAMTELSVSTTYRFQVWAGTGDGMEAAAGEVIIKDSAGLEEINLAE